MKTEEAKKLYEEALEDLDGSIAVGRFLVKEAMKAAMADPDLLAKLGARAKDVAAGGASAVGLGFRVFAFEKPPETPERTVN